MLFTWTQSSVEQAAWPPNTDGTDPRPAAIPEIGLIAGKREWPPMAS
jgi:hypothetical protein